MRHFITILSHEIRMLLVSASTYVTATLFLAFMGFIFSGVLENYGKGSQDSTPATLFFQLFWLPVLFMVPLLTMKSISEERRHGTMETLLTSPVTTTEVVLGKYFASYFLYIGLWASTAFFFYVLYLFVRDPVLVDFPSLVGSYLFVAASGLFFVALGILASSLTRNQAVAGILTFVFLFLAIIGIRFVTTLELMHIETMTPVRDMLDYASIFRHLDDFSRGVIDIRQVLYYVSASALTLLLSILSIEARQIHS